MKTLSYGASLLAVTFAAQAFAQDQQQNQTAQERSAAEDVMVLSEWNYDTLYASGWSVERVIDETDVVGATGEELGSIENIIFSDEGQVLAVIAEIGGFLDIGDTHVAIPWEEVELSADAARMTVPVTEETVEDYSVFETGFFFETDAETITQVDDDLETGAMVFKATDLIGDYAYLSENARYGYVNDLVVNDGTISAVVIDAAAYGRPGYYAYPYYGYRAHPSYYPRYNLPYTGEEIAVLEEFDYDRMQTGIAADDTTSATGDNQDQTETEAAD